MNVNDAERLAIASSAALATSWRYPSADSRPCENRTRIACDSEALILGFFDSRNVRQNLITRAVVDGRPQYGGMIEFFPPILEHFCPLFVLIAQMGLMVPRWSLFLPRIPPPTPVIYFAVTHPFWGYVGTQNTPTPPQTPLFMA